jgi:hypothetical protein
MKESIMKRWLYFSLLTLQLSLLCAAQAVRADTAAARTPESLLPPPVKAHPVLKFQGAASGKTAVDRLKNANALVAVAQYHGMTAFELEKILLQDPTAFIDDTGHLFYRDKPPLMMPAR